MERVVNLEWLDQLSPEDRRAAHSRADLRRLNVLMGHAGIIARLWGKTGVPTHPQSLVEIGAGDGTFCLRLFRQVRSRVEKVTLVDRQDVACHETRAALAGFATTVEVLARDVFEWLESGPRATVTIANLFLHHFKTAELKRLLMLVSEKTDFFIACEPRRGGAGLIGSHLLRLIGCNDVTRHDAVLSVQAGFCADELSQLWPAGEWEIAEQPAGLFSHSFAARRIRAAARVASQ